MTDYQKAFIYKLVSDKINKIYIGSSAETLEIRFRIHKYKKNRCYSKILFDLGEVEIKKLEDYPCNNDNELRQREQYYMDLYKPRIVNKNKAYVTEDQKKEQNNNRSKENYQKNKDQKKEYQNEYRQKNKDKIKKKKKVYEQNNKDKIKDRKAIYYLNNKDKIKEYNKEYNLKNKKKYKTI